MLSERLNAEVLPEGKITGCVFSIIAFSLWIFISFIKDNSFKKKSVDRIYWAFKWVSTGRHTITEDTEQWTSVDLMGSLPLS